MYDKDIRNICLRIFLVFYCIELNILLRMHVYQFLKAQMTVILDSWVELRNFFFQFEHDLIQILNSNNSYRIGFEVIIIEYDCLRLPEVYI